MSTEPLFGSCQRATLVEVAPRDGLQSLARIYTTETKVALVDLLSRIGIPKIEVSSFVRPDVVPQLADAEEVFARINRRSGVTYRGVCANRRGAERAAAAGADEVLAFITASQTYNTKNSNMTIEQNLVELGAVAGVLKREGIPLVVGLGVCTFCPYEGEIPVERVVRLTQSIAELGVAEIYIGTSVGVDGPRKVFEITAMILESWPTVVLGLHMHNTNGMALANALAGLEAGVSVFEGSICGIGGGIRMPDGMAPCGNVASEDLVQLFDEIGVSTGVAVADAVGAARSACDLLELEHTSSAALMGGTKADVLEHARLGGARPLSTL